MQKAMAQIRLEYQDTYQISFLTKSAQMEEYKIPFPSKFPNIESEDFYLLFLYTRFQKKQQLYFLPESSDSVHMPFL